jgi:hypothetical protein
MARGWESKSVEDQIDAAEAKRQSRARPILSADQRKQDERKQSLVLARTQILNRLRTATNKTYRAQLQKTLDYLNAQLEEFE